MKKILFFVAIFATTMSFAQNAYWAMEFKVKPHSEKELTEAFEKAFKDVKIKQGGVSFENLGTGSLGMTHRIVFSFTLGVEMMEKDAINPDRNDAFWSKLEYFVEQWGPSYSGRALSFQIGDTINHDVHIWDIKVKDATKFKAAQDQLVKDFKDDFAGRDVGFGTYDIGRPNGATHWMYLSGKDSEDHLKILDKLEKQPKFIKYIQDRGEVIDVKDFELYILKSKH
jgi:hypothetical protein